MMERIENLLASYREATAQIPFVVEALEKGHQFNAYESGSNDDDMPDVEREYQIGIGPISDFRRLLDVEGSAVALLFESALKLAAEIDRVQRFDRRPDESEADYICRLLDMARAR